MAGCVSLREFERGETLFWEGDPCAGLHIVRTGCVKLYRLSPQGRQYIVRLVQEKDTFDEVSVFDGGGNPVNAEALEPSRVWVVEPDCIRRTLMANPEFARKVIYNLGLENLRALVQAVSEMAFYQVTHRLIAGIRKLPAAHRLVHQRGLTSVHRYWDLAAHFASVAAPRTLDDAAERLDALVSRAVRRRSRSDVPVGVFLSGGLDSSSVLAHLTEQAGPGVPVFALGHRDPAFDESRFARETGSRFGAAFHELILGEQDLEEGLRRVGEGFDEPLGDASPIPTHLLSLHARPFVKVCPGIGKLNQHLVCWCSG